MAESNREEAQALYEQMTVVDLQAELGERTPPLPKTGTKPELVARLLDADFPPATPSPDEAEQPDVAPDADQAPDVEDGELCAVCWPDGWPSSDTNNASCEHGVWDR
ncbi:SAP domain-containing protein [Amycolatopsis vancoresmycina]|nr:SAP domain-containing protein [Amycolatopsis vancoresmycina]